MSNEYRVQGPPGTGKTTHLAKQVENAVRRHGSDSVLVTSLTKAAALEVAGRDLPIDPERIGTLHSHCFHALDKPGIAQDKKNIKLWNEYVDSSSKAHLSLSGSANRDDFGGHGEKATVGDELLAQADIYRARMLPREKWLRASVAEFFDAWCTWKEANYLMDFTDLIEAALRDVEKPPFRPRFLFTDEAQDLSFLEMTLVRKWARHCEKVIFCGDPDQTLYFFRGSSAENFTTPAIPEENYIELKQSYRVPWTVHRIALDWIRQIKDRRDVEYLPRDAEGEVDRLNLNYLQPEFIFGDAEKYLETGKSVMFLATAGYMLKPLIAFFRDHGVPFHNPYTTKRGDWNPLAKRKGASIAERVRAFLYCQWLTDPEELWLWLEMLKLDHWRRDKDVTVNFLKELKGKMTLTEIGSLFADEAIRRATDSDLEWLYEGMLSRFKGSQATRYALKVAERDETGVSLTKTPQICVGSVHSVKGGESDVCYVFPDLSPAADDEYVVDESSIIRVFYVAMTRARETLVLCDGASRSRRCVEI